ncbi:MAG: hypothetical protein AAFX40_18015 [Cyanobacteria bacterium J06639_1]
MERFAVRPFPYPSIEKEFEEDMRLAIATCSQDFAAFETVAAECQPGAKTSRLAIAHPSAT